MESHQTTNYVRDYIYVDSGSRINMSDADVLLGVVGAGHIEVLHLIHITVKQHIQACRCNNIHPTLAAVEMELKDIHAIEKSIAIKIILYSNMIKSVNC